MAGGSGTVGVGTVGGRVLDRSLAPMPRLDQERPTHHHGQNHGGCARGDCGRAAPSRRPDPTMQFGEANTLTSLDGLGALRQSPEVLGVHDQPPSLTGSNAASSRNLANALAHWLFTVPTEQPSSCAVSASVRSSR